MPKTRFQANKAVYQNLWRIAYRKGGLKIPCQSKAEVERLRFLLYNAVKEARAGREFADDELCRAVETITLRRCGEESEGFGLQLVSEESTPLGQMISRIIAENGMGRDEASQSAEDIAANESKQRLLKLLNTDSEAGAGNVQPGESPALEVDPANPYAGILRRTR